MKIKPNLQLTCYLLATLLFLLTACQTPGFSDYLQTTPVNDEASARSSSATPPPSPTATHAPTHRPSPTATNTLTATITPTVTPTQFLGFKDAWVYQSYADYKLTIFYFIVPGVTAPYYGTVDGYDLTCEPDPSQVNLLVCRSDKNLYGTNLKDFEFFADQGRTFLIHEGTFATYLYVIPATPTIASIIWNPPPPTSGELIWPRADFSAADISWGPTPADCPERGVNLTCEIEYRHYDDNSCLVGMSCFDTCGYYYSVDTIKDKTGEYTFSGPCW
jgi:hypothetical protein